MWSWKLLYPQLNFKKMVTKFAVWDSMNVLSLHDQNGDDKIWNEAP
jgi:hypothetical protein